MKLDSSAIYSETVTLDQVLISRAATDPHRICLTDKRQYQSGKEYSYSDLEHYRVNLKKWMTNLKVSQGERVGLYLEDCIQSLAMVYAVWSLGAILVPLDHRQTGHNLSNILEAADIKHVFYRSQFESIEFLKNNKPYLNLHVIPESYPEKTLGDARSKATAEDIAIIAYTSGTTSNPKGVIMRHVHLRRAYTIAKESLFEKTPNKFGNVFKVGGLGVLGLNYLFAMECDSEVVILPELNIGSARNYLSVLESNQIDFLYLVPILVQLMQRLTKLSIDYKCFQVVTGAAPISENLHSEFQNKFGVALRNIYGMTEVSFGILYGRFKDTRLGAWDLGPEVQGIPLRIRNLEGTLIDGPGEGVLEVSGITVTDGYLDNPTATEAVFKNGWVVSGDIVRRDKYGNYKVVGRTKDVVIRGGFNIHLDEIDHAIMLHPKVLSAGTISLCQHGDTEGIFSLIQVLDATKTNESDILEFIREKLGSSKTPNRIFIQSARLPKNSSGKLLKREIKSIIEALVND